MEYAILFVTGFAGGVLAGLLGLGGGVFYVLVLPYIFQFFGFPPDEATPFIVANSLFGIAFASFSSLISQYKSVDRYLTEILVIGVPAVIASLLANTFVVHSSWFSMKLFSMVIILLMVFIIIKMIIQTKSDNYKTDKKIPTKAGILSGAFSGAISALSGLGGGVVIIPILEIYFHQDIKKSKVISLAIIFVISSFISVQNLLGQPSLQLEGINNWGYIIPLISLPLVVGVLFGGPLGVRVSKFMSSKTINILFVIIVVLVLVEKLTNLNSM